MTVPSSDDMETVKHLLNSDPIFKEKMDTATSIADKIGREALAEIYAAQSSVKQLNEGGYPSEMEEIIRKKAEGTFRRYAKFMGAMVRLVEPRLSGEYGPVESPVHSLPPEMLSAIFTLTADIPFVVDGQWWTPRVLRLVCRHWKKLAEETPTLWRKVDLTGGLQWTEHALRWSKSVTLDVRMGGRVYYPTTFMKCAEAALEELPRIHSLQLSAYGNLELQAFADLFASQSAPFLAELHFLGESSTLVDVFHDNTFAGEVPTRLRVLSVASAGIVTSSPLFRAPLTTLDLQSCEVWENADELLHTLSILPMLKHLKLWTDDDDLRIDVSKVHDFRPKAVKLLNLKSLSLRDDIKVILVIFKYLDIPHVTTVSIGADDDNIDSFMGSNVLSEMDSVFGTYLTHLFGNTATPSDAFTCLTVTSFQEEYGSGYDTLFTGPSIHRDGLTEFSVGFDLDPDFMDESRALFMRTLSWTPMSFCITRLIATEWLELLDGDDIWIQILQCLHNLEEVHIGKSAPYFVQSISARGPEEARSIRKLVFKGVTPLEDGSIDKVVALLSGRHDLGYPPVALSYIACKIPGPAVAKLRETAGIDPVYVHPAPPILTLESDSVDEDV
ncbi:unnamed protein product [Peniophora sp. CBMAI 1063]|nr:unnamed protein product [Peniophora sp. CBMAI 1063]